MKDEDKTKEQFSEQTETLPSNVKIKKSENKCKPPEKALLIEENFYRALFENTATPVVILEEDNTILLANGECEKLTGYTREDVEGRKKWTEFVHRKDDLERLKEYNRLRRIDPLSAPQTYEFQFVDREGQIKDIVVNVRTMPGRKHTLATLLDISDRKRAEAALTESESRLADIIDFLPDATFAIDPSSKVIAWNRAMEEMTGVKAEDMLGKGNYEYTIPFYGMRRPILIDLALGFAEANENEYDFVKRQGNVFLAETDVTMRGVPRKLWGKAGPLYDSYGKVAGAIESVRDVTELRQAEKALQKAYDELEIRVGERTAELVAANKALQKEILERKRTEAVLKKSEDKFAISFFKSPIPMAVTAINDGRYVDVNEAFMNVMGVKYEELVGNSSTGAGYISCESRALFLEEYRQKGFVENFELPMQVKDGELKRGLFNSSKITIGCEDFFLTSVTDITKLRQVEEELRKYREDLEALVSERTSELESRTKNLQEVNTTLNVLLHKREEDKKIMEERFVANIGSLVLPYVEKIKKNNLDAQQQLCLDIIEKNLDEIASPLLKIIHQFDLTPREVQVASLINDGKTTKEIAKTLGIGKGSVDTHRKNIRKKLGLDRTSNLQSHLRFLEK